MMHSIWSRAAQTRGCGCTLCLPRAAGVVVRNASGRLSRRKPTVTQLLTACYTSIMAGAALADAQYKDIRREEMDRKLEEAQRHLTALRKKRLGQHQGQVARVEETPMANQGEDEIEQPRFLQQPKVEWHKEKSLKRPPSRQPFFLDAIVTEDVRTETLLKWQSRYEQRDGLRHIIHRNFGLKRYWGSNQVDTWMDLTAASARIENFQEHFWFWEREPMTPTQFKMNTISVENLVNDLTFETVQVSYPDDPVAAQRAFTSLDGSMTKLKFLRSDGYPCFQHPHHEPDKTKEWRMEFSRVTRLIFRDWEDALKQAEITGRKIEPFWYQTMVHKICHNLLVSSVAPGVHNYNTLLNGFTRVGQHSLAQIVAGHMRASYAHPTYQTLECLLQHYRESRDILGFYRTMRAIPALDDWGMKVKRRSVEQVLQEPYKMKWIRSGDIAVTEEYVYEAMRIDKNVLAALVRGLLSFDRVEAAAKIFVSALEDKIVLGTRALCTLVEKILDTLDQTSAKLVLHHGLMRHVDYFEDVIRGRSEASKQLRRRLRPLFDLADTEPWSPSMSAMSFSGTHPNNRRLVVAMFMADAQSYLAYIYKVIFPAVEACLSPHLATPIEPFRKAIEESVAEDTSDDAFEEVFREAYNDPLVQRDTTPRGEDLIFTPDEILPPLSRHRRPRIDPTSLSLSETLDVLSCCEPAELFLEKSSIYHPAAERLAIFEKATKMENAVNWAKEELIATVGEDLDEDIKAILHDPSENAMERVQLSMDIRAQRQAARSAAGDAVQPTEADAAQKDLQWTSILARIDRALSALRMRRAKHPYAIDAKASEQRPEIDEAVRTAEGIPADMTAAELLELRKRASMEADRLQGATKLLLRERVAGGNVLPHFEQKVW